MVGCVPLTLVYGELSHLAILMTSTSNMRSFISAKSINLSLMALGMWGSLKVTAPFWWKFHFRSYLILPLPPGTHTLYLRLQTAATLALTPSFQLYVFNLNNIVLITIFLHLLTCIHKHTNVMNRWTCQKSLAASSFINWVTTRRTDAHPISRMSFS